MTLNEFIYAIHGCRILLIGELHKRPDDQDAILYLLYRLRKKVDLHFFVEYFDSTQNEVIQPYLKGVELHAKPKITDLKAGFARENIRHLILEKIWDKKYFGGGGNQTFKDSWLHKDEMDKIQTILTFANRFSIPVKGIDLPLTRGALGSEFPKVMGKTPSFTEWDQGRDTWMASHLLSFYHSADHKDQVAVCFVGAAHCHGIKYGKRNVKGVLKRTVGIVQQELKATVVIIEPDFDTDTDDPKKFIEPGKKKDDYEIRPSATQATMSFKYR